jgi:hypothetical protein
MPARWSFEAMVVEQFKNNKYEKIFFPYDMKISQNEWYASFLIKDLKIDLQECRDSMSFNEEARNNLKKIDFYIRQMFDKAGYDLPEDLSSALKEEGPTPQAFEQIGKYLDFLEKDFRVKKREAWNSKDSLLKTIGINDIEMEKLVRLRTDYTNNGLVRFVLNEEMIEKSVQTPKRIIQKFEPVFKPPVTKNGRSHFCAPFKMIGTMKVDTFSFNMIIIWLVSVFLYLALYFNLLRRVISKSENPTRRKSDSKFLIIKEISSW